MELFNTQEYTKKEEKSTKANYHFKLEQLIPWSDSELIKDNIAESEVVEIAGIWGFNPNQIEKLIRAKKYNKKYNPSCDSDWVRLTKVFRS